MHHPNESPWWCIDQDGTVQKEEVSSKFSQLLFDYAKGNRTCKEKDVRHGIQHFTFGSDGGDLSKLGQSHDPDERLLPSAKDRNVPFLESHIESSWLSHGQDHRANNEFQSKIIAKAAPLPKDFQMSIRVGLMINLFPPFSLASLPLLTHKSSLHPR